MHKMQVIGGGFVLLLAFVLGARFSGLSMTGAALVFIPVWFVAASVNLWNDTIRAGHSFAAEGPRFLVVFGVPAMLATYWWWTYSPQ